jgi:hypothetical protein
LQPDLRTLGNILYPEGILGSQAGEWILGKQEALRNYIKEGGIILVGA